MTFDVHRLDHLDAEDVEEVLADYIDEAIEQFEASPEGQAHVSEHPDCCGWISSFIELGFNYEGRSLPAMTLRTVEQMMESLLPRKITVMEAAEAEEALPELAAFWTFLSRAYQLPNADEIAVYLRSIEGQFGEWMVDPARGGMAKNFILSGMQAGYDMTSEEGLVAYQQAYNAQLRKAQGQGSLKQTISNLLGASSELDNEAMTARSPQSKKKKANAKKTKGFGAAVDARAAHRQKK